MVTKLRTNGCGVCGCLRVVLFLMVTKHSRFIPLDFIGLRVVLFLMVTKPSGLTPVFIISLRVVLFLMVTKRKSVSTI